MYLWTNEGATTAGRYITVIIIITVNFLLPLLRQGLTSVPLFLFLSVTDTALRNFVHIRTKQKMGMERIS